MKYFLLSLLVLSMLSSGIAQTNPTALSLPVSEDFGTANFATPKPGMASWTGDGARPYLTQATAEASLSGTDVTITSGEPSSGASGGQYGGTLSGNGRLSILQSGNATNGTSQIAMAINTTGATTVTVAYELTMPVVNPRDIGVALQYRVGASGAFTTVTGTAVIYSNASTNGGDADGPTDFDSYSFALPAAAGNQALVQLRWITWQPSGTGARSAIGLDNINVTSGAAVACTTPTAQATALSLTATSSSISGSFTAASPAASNYLVIYSTSATLTATPVDGTTYTAGQSLGGGIVLQYNNTTSFIINVLPASTLYYVYIFSANSGGCTGGPRYLTTTPLTGNIATAALAACTTPTANATALTLTPTSNTVNGNFVASATANNYLVVRSTNATLSASPINGTTYTSGAAFGGGIVVQYNNNTSFSVAGLVANTQYYFFVYAANGNCAGQPFYVTTPLVANTTTLNGGQPATYYTAANGLSCYPLKTALFNIISANTTVLSYTPGVWNAYQTTDMTRNFENTADIIFDMYSNRGPGLNEPYEFTFGTNQCGNYNAEGQCYNREHSMPQSWFASASPMVSDIHHLVPTDGSVNGARGNFAYGNVGAVNYTSQNGSKRGTSGYPGFTGTVFEPINEYKGDFARMQFYMATRYQNLIAGWQNNSNANDVLNGTSDQVYDDWQLKQLYDWHIQDPVSAKEIARNNAVFAIQGNRNPFIDSAQYVFRIWGCTGLLPAPLPTPLVINVSNKCQNAPNALGKLTNPPAATTIAVTLDGTAVTYNSADSTFQYFVSNTTPVGNRLVKVTYTNITGSTFRDTIYTVTAPTAPTATISGSTTVNSGQATTISTSITNGGTMPTYQWQDSVSATSWQNIAGATASTINYTAAATGVKLRCILTSNSTCATAPTAISNVLTFTIALPTPVIINVSNKCFTDATARGKLTNPPAAAIIAVTLDGAAVTYTPADSSFTYFTSSTTTVGNHTVRATYTQGTTITVRDSIYTVTAQATPTIVISGTTTVISGQATSITSTITNGGLAPTYQWQDSISALGWVNVVGASTTTGTLSYTPLATGNKLRCRLTSNATNCVNVATITSNVITFTVNTATSVGNVNGLNFGIQLFPNPVRNVLNLTSLRLTDKWIKAEIWGINGQTNILQKNIQNQTTTQLNVATLPSGVYYVVLRRNNASNAYIKFIKL